MNYLIIMPKISQNDEEAYYFPIGIAYVSASLKQSGRNVITLNLNYKTRDLNEILSEIIEENFIDVVAIGGLSRQYQDIFDVLKITKGINSNIKTLVGGGIITSDPITAMRALENADYGMIGEGEITICELADALENKRQRSAVNGIIFKEGEEWIRTNPRKEIADLDSIPFPDYKGFEFGKMLEKRSMSVQYGDNLAYVISSRSCPYNCTFCFHPSGSKYRVRSIKNVFQEIDWLITNYPQIKNVRLNDELFGLNKNFVEKFCSEIKKRKLGFSVQMRVDNVTEHIANLLKEAGCISVNFGLESANNMVLKSMRKNITIEQINNALSICNNLGLSARGNFIFGDIEETFETAMETFNWWKNHPQYSIALSNIIVYPGSYLYKYSVENGIISDQVQFLKDGCPQINVSKMKDQEYRTLIDIINKSTTIGVQKLESTKIVYSGAGRINFSAKCPYCSSQTTWNEISVFSSFTDVICTNCKKGIKLLVADYIDDTAENNLKSMLDKPIAIWPMNTAVVNMCQKVPSILNDNVYIVDSSPIKQGSIFENKEIYSPNIIKEKNIQTVFVSNVYVVGNDIINILKKDYKNVKNIFYIDELINKRFLNKIEE